MRSVQCEAQCVAYIASRAVRDVQCELAVVFLRMGLTSTSMRWQADVRHKW